MNGLKSDHRHAIHYREARGSIIRDLAAIGVIMLIASLFFGR